MLIISDLHIHSRFSRAVSKKMTLEFINFWAGKKGIGIVATSDWTHPMWFREIERDLEELGNGLLKVKSEKNTQPLFLLSTEISCIYSQGGKGRRIHILVWLPSLISARKISQEMTRRGLNLLSDGRPIIGLSAEELTDLVLNIEPRALVIPAHVWTPWFSLYGSMSGFDSVNEAFGKYADSIYAMETGLSSNPAMNWQIEEIKNRNTVSFSDAHSAVKLGREAVVFDFHDQASINYDGIYEAISERFRKIKNPKNKIAYTIEFYPEEGKYHYTGHRNCNVRLTPDEEKKKGSTCTVCGKPLTQGVMQRVSELASKSISELNIRNANRLFPKLADDVQMVISKALPDRPPYIMTVPLIEIVGECVETAPTSKKAQGMYERLIDIFGSEFNILLSVPVKDIAAKFGDRVAAGIKKVRSQDLAVDPGYDGVFGVVKLWRDDEEKPLIDSSREQLSIF